MLVRLTTGRVGPCNTDKVGDVVDVPHEEARRLIRSGQAEEVTREDGAPAVVETNAVVAPERTANARPLPRKGKPQ